MENAFAHAAVDVDAEALQRFAAVRPTGSARPAIPTIQVRFDGATIARLESVRSLWNRNDLDAEFVAEDARVFEERLSPGKGVKIGATNPHSTHSNESMIRWHRRLGHVRRKESTGFVQGDLEHGDTS